MMTLDEALADISEPSGKRLKIDKILDRIDADDAERLRDIMRGWDYSSYMIAKILTKMGHGVTNNAVDCWRSHNRKISADSPAPENAA